MDVYSYITENYEKIKCISKIHCRKYCPEIVISNLYIYLHDRGDLQVDKIEGLIVNYCRNLDRYKQSYNLTEQMKEAELLTEPIIFDELLNIDFDKEIKAFERSLKSISDRCIIRDYYNEVEVKTVEGIMKFYNVKKSTAYMISKRQKLLNKKLFVFLEKQLI